MCWTFSTQTLWVYTMQNPVLTLATQTATLLFWSQHADCSSDVWNLFWSRWKSGCQDPSLLFGIVLNKLSGTCLRRLQPTVALPTWKDTQCQWLATSASDSMTLLPLTLSPHKTAAFVSGYKAAMRRANLWRVEKIHNHFQDTGGTWQMYHGIWTIINYRTSPQTCVGEASLPKHKTTWQQGINQVLCLTMTDVRKCPWKFKIQIL